MLEVMMHSASMFVTLTYSDENLPDSGVQVRDVQLFLKRLRKAVEPLKVRYYVVGEYGDRTGRAHYHAVLFGLFDAEVVAKCWPHGHVHCGEVTWQSAAYVASHTTKSVGDKRPYGKNREFCQMSRRPGLGFGAVERIADFYLSRVGSSVLADAGDVGAVVRSDGKLWPLGRYLRGKVREACGMDSSWPKSAELRRVCELLSAGVFPEVLEAEGRSHEVQAVERVKRQVLRRKSREAF